MSSIAKGTVRFIFITGGVVSSLGKGLSAATIGALLQARNFKVRIRKFDPYLNIDPGTMSPVQHGEVFVTDDGKESDLDLGYYERFTGVEATENDSITSGKIYDKLLKRERNGEYLGQTVQVIPHVTDIIKSFIFYAAENVDFMICEIGGTVGDIEGLPFLESIRQIHYQLGKERTIFIHLTLVPYIAAAKELKTKPTQHSVKELNSIGIQPDIILCRSEKILSQDHINKIANFCNLSPNNVIPALDVENIYELPINYYNHGLDKQILQHFKIVTQRPNLDKWQKILLSVKNAEKEVNIAVVGKYTNIFDAYKSVFEALKHAAIHNKVKLNIKLLDSRAFDGNAVRDNLSDVDGILIPGGFGNDGIEGKLLAINYARSNNVPFFGICMGMQLAVIEFARNVAMLKGANSTEFNESCPFPVVKLINDSVTGDVDIGERNKLSGKMCLGAYTYYLQSNSKAANIYNQEIISERCRNRYIVNVNYRDLLEQYGLVFSGKSENLLGIIELSGHSWFIGTQFHPEFKSSPFIAHPLFISFIESCCK